MPWYGWLVILALIALAVVCVVVKAKKRSGIFPDRLSEQTLSPRV